VIANVFCMACGKPMPVTPFGVIPCAACSPSSLPVDPSTEITESERAFGERSAEAVDLRDEVHRLAQKLAGARLEVASLRARIFSILMTCSDETQGLRTAREALDAIKQAARSILLETNDG
jgi:hypothetical protein